MKVLFFLIVSLFAFNSYAQSGLSTIVPNPQPGFHPYDALIHNDSIIWYGNSFSDSITFPQVLLISKCDSNGNFIQSTLSSDSLGGLFATNYTFGEIVKDSNFFVSTAGMVGRTSAFLFKFDHNLKEVIRKEYFDTINISNFRYKIINVKGGYLLFGSIQKPNLDICAFVRYVDKQGEIIWHKFIDFSTFSGTITQGVQAINDTTFLASCSASNKRRCFLVFDLEGNDIKKWVSEEYPAIGYSREIIDAKDGFLLYGMAFQEEVNGVSVTKPVFSKLDTAFNIQWISTINVRSWSHPYNNLLDFELAPNGDILAAGAISVRPAPNEPSKGFGWLVRYSATGDSIWGLHIPPPAGMEKGELTSVGQLSSGSIVGMGTAFSPTGRQYAWLVKVSPDGCLDTSLCATVPLYEPFVEEVGFSVSPNPTQGYLRIKINHSFDIASISFFNLLGDLCRTTPLEQSISELDISDLPTGLYFYTIRQGAKTVQSGKILKTE